MSSGSPASMKIILISGIAVFVGLMLLSMAMKKALRPDESEVVRISASASPFDMDRAFADLKFITGLGPRPAGSEKAASMREYLRRELENAGLAVSEHAFDADTPLGVIKMVNLAAEVGGDRPGLILLTNHYDTKHFTDFEFVGANDGGSTTAWMLEMARALGPKRAGRTLRLVWFDGEESFGRWSETDGLYGSRAYAALLKEKGELQSVGAVVNVDMIGDRYLCVARDPDAPQWLKNAVWGTAQRLGYGRHFAAGGSGVQDDHIPFRREGIPALEVIDFSYGGTIAQHRANWHTANDTLDKVAPGSLKAVADVIYHALPVIDTQLDRKGATRNP